MWEDDEEALERDRQLLRIGRAEQQERGRRFQLRRVIAVRRFLVADDVIAECGEQGLLKIEPRIGQLDRKSVV